MDPRLIQAANLHRQKNYPLAEAICRQVLGGQPRNVDALLLLGCVLHEAGQNELALEALRRGVKIQPNRPDLRQAMVGPLVAVKRLADAITEARELVRLSPLVADTHYAVAQLYLQAGDPVSAVPYAKRAAELAPRSAAVFVTLSRAYFAQNAIADAMKAIEQALRVDPNHADALIDRGSLFQAQGRLDEAMITYEMGLKVAPKNVAAWNNLGACRLMKGRAHEAIQCFESAALIWPHSPKPRCNVGAALKEMGLIDDSIVHFKKAIEIDPRHADAYCNIGASYATIAEHALAIDAYQKALQLQPDFSAVASNLLMSLLSPTTVPPQALFEAHLDWDQRYTAASYPANPPVIQAVPTDRRIRIAYVSPDFREHSISYFMEPILAHHDRSRFDVRCYAAGRRRDHITQRLTQLVENWHHVAELDERQFADLIRSHQIDILIDLAGHTSDHRLRAFGSKPAPVQVAYLGYPSTTGLKAMDYRLTDAIADPTVADVFYTEKLVRLPHAFFVFQDDPAMLFDPVLPCDRHGVFTFGSFNGFTKFNDETLESWATILGSVPNSRLLMKAKPLDNPSTRQKVLGFFANRGVASNRIDLRTWVTMAEHHALLGTVVDLMLDTFPYNGHTTSCQSIWMGVPMVTRVGDTFRARVGQSIMQNLDLMDFVARSTEQYQQIAINLAHNPDRLREIRPTLRQRMIQSPLCDAAGFVRSLENAYVQMIDAKSRDHE